MASCPKCGGSLADPFVTRCPECSAELPRYGDPVAAIQEATERFERGEAPAPQLVSRVVGLVQGMLDTAREDLQKNFRALGTLPPAAANLRANDQIEMLAFVETFHDIQEQVNDGLLRFSQVLSDGDLEKGQHVLDYVTARMQDSVDRLEVLYRQSSNPILLNRPTKPLPGQVMQSLGSMEKAMAAVTRYIDTRDRALLKTCVANLDEARAMLASLLDAEP